MKSNICVVKKGGVGLEKILAEVEKVASYNELQKKEVLRLRLLAEELVGMLPELLENFEGSFWLKNDDKKYELHMELCVENLSKEKKNAIIAVSANKKNAAASSFMGKIRDIAENMLLNSDNPEVYCFTESDYLYGYGVADVNYAYAWTLDHYVQQHKERAKDDDEAWDELEKSIVAKLADDVIVGVRSKKVEIIIKKEF